jgi:hypothetical protein
VIDMASTKYEANKFNGKHNFFIWKRRIKSLLIQRGQQGIVGKREDGLRMDNGPLSKRQRLMAWACIRVLRIGIKMPGVSMGGVNGVKCKGLWHRYK